MKLKENKTTDTKYKKYVFIGKNEKGRARERQRE